MTHLGIHRMVPGNFEIKWGFLGQWIGGAGHLSTIDGAPARR
jgi:hypothetical protein